MWWRRGIGKQDSIGLQAIWTEITPNNAIKPAKLGCIKSHTPPGSDKDSLRGRGPPPRRNAEGAGGGGFDPPPPSKPNGLVCPPPLGAICSHPNRFRQSEASSGLRCDIPEATAFAPEEDDVVREAELEVERHGF